jgi:hypothetical protein
MGDCDDIYVSGEPDVCDQLVTPAAAELPAVVLEEERGTDGAKGANVRGWGDTDRVGTLEYEWSIGEGAKVTVRGPVEGGGGGGAAAAAVFPLVEAAAYVAAD